MVKIKLCDNKITCMVLLQSIKYNRRKIVGIMMKNLCIAKDFLSILESCVADASAHDKIDDNLLQQSKSARQIAVCKRSYNL